MKVLKYIMLVALIIWSDPLQAMNEQKAVEAEQEKKAINLLKESIRKRNAKLGKGTGIKVFGSTENPISLELEENSNGEWYQTTNALAQMLKQYVPHIPKLVVEKSNAKGDMNIGLFVAYRDESKTTAGDAIKGKPLFFLKISRPSLLNIPKSLDALQKGPIGRLSLHNRNLPIIVLQEMFFICKGKDNKNYTIEVMHMAHGKQLSNILETETDLTLIQRCAEKVGKALGAFHAKFMNYHNSESPGDWETMTHGDFSVFNVFFDAKTARVYFIDNGTMDTDKPYKDVARLKSLAYLAIDECNEKYANYVIYFIKGYLSAYALDKRKSMAQYLKDSYLTDRTAYLQRKSITQHPETIPFIDRFITEINHTFSEACK